MRQGTIRFVGTNVVDYLSADGANKVAVSVDVHDLAAMQASLRSPELAAAKKAHGVLSPRRCTSIGVEPRLCEIAGRYRPIAADCGRTSDSPSPGTACQPSRSSSKAQVDQWPAVKYHLLPSCVHLGATHFLVGSTTAIQLPSVQT